MNGGEVNLILMNDNLQEIKLHPRQAEVFWCPKRFRVVNAGRRFGKTVLAIAEMIRTASMIPGSKSIYFAPTLQGLYQQVRIVYLHLLTIHSILLVQ